MSNKNTNLADVRKSLEHLVKIEVPNVPADTLTQLGEVLNQLFDDFIAQHEGKPASSADIRGKLLGYVKRLDVEGKLPKNKDVLTIYGQLEFGCEMMAEQDAFFRQQVRAARKSKVKQ